MKTIALCALLFLLNVGVVVSGGLNGELVILNWLSALYIVFLSSFMQHSTKKLDMNGFALMKLKLVVVGCLSPQMQKS